MADELDLDLDSLETNEEITRKDKRLKSLSDKVKEKEELLVQESEAKKKLEEERASLSIERDFFKGFNQVSAKYPSANEYQDKIFEKVKGGYEVEDAAISILAKEGKLNQAPPPPENIRAAGGSASTSITDSADKTPQEMTQDERRAVLADLESRGDLKL